MADAVERARSKLCAPRPGPTRAPVFLAHLDSLDADDLERLAVCAYLVGKEPESDAAWTRAYRQRLTVDDRDGAVRCAFWIGFRLVNAHERPDANGWIARLGRLVDDIPAASLPRARLAYLTGLRAVFDDGNPEASVADLGRAADLATLHLDDELAALARLALGRVLIFQGKITDGVRLLDEAMLTMRSELLSPIAVGDSYCTAIDACHDLFDVQRGQEWTDGLTRWCAEQPDLVPYRGHLPGASGRVPAAERSVGRGDGAGRAGAGAALDTVPAAALWRGGLPGGRAAAPSRRLRPGRGVLPGGERGGTGPAARPGAAQAEPGPERRTPRRPSTGRWPRRMTRWGAPNCWRRSSR